MSKLLDYIESLGRTPIIPLMGYPGTRLTCSSIKLNEFNWGLHAWTLQAMYERFQPDGVFLLMDLAVEASGMGLQVRFPLLESPSVEIHPVQTENDLDQFKAVDILTDGRAYAFIETLKQLRRLLPTDCLRGAYVTGPFTLAGLLCGASDIAMNVILNPNLVHRILELATQVVVRYARALEAAGAQMIMILDPTVVMVGPHHFDEFVAGYVKNLIDALTLAMPIYHVCGDTTHLLERFIALGVQGISLDSMVDMADAANRVPRDVVLMGNVSPVDVMCHQKPQAVRDEVCRIRERMSAYSNFILSTGCDLPREVPFENIEAFLDAGRE